MDIFGVLKREDNEKHPPVYARYDLEYDRFALACHGSSAETASCAKGTTYCPLIID